MRFKSQNSKLARLRVGFELHRGYLYQNGVEFRQKMIGAGLNLFWGHLHYFSGGIWTFPLLSDTYASAPIAERAIYFPPTVCNEWHTDWTAEQSKLPKYWHVHWVLHSNVDYHIYATSKKLSSKLREQWALSHWWTKYYTHTRISGPFGPLKF